MRRTTRGQALVELAIVLPLLLALVALAAGAALWGHRQLDVLERAREAAWAAATGGRLPATGGATVRRPGARLVRAEATGQPPAPSPFLRGGSTGPLPPARLTATLEIDTVPLAAGTEAAGLRSVRERWLGGQAAAPLATMIKLFIREEPVRVDFDARPPRRGSR